LVVKKGSKARRWTSSVGCTGPHQTDGQFLTDLTGHDDERHVQVAGAQQGERRVGAERGHGVVGDHEVGMVLAQGVGHRLGGLHPPVVHGHAGLP
jgi:hypothetical protein